MGVQETETDSRVTTLPRFFSNLSFRFSISIFISSSTSDYGGLLEIIYDPLLSSGAFAFIFL